MNTRTVLAVLAVVVAGLVVSAAALVGLFVVAPTVLADRYSHYDYEFTVETNATMTDVTLYLPLPVGPDGPKTGRVAVRDDAGDAVANDTAVVESEHGPMLSVSVDRLAGSLEYLLLTFDEDGNLTSRERIDPDEVPEDMTNRKLSPISTRYTVHVFYDDPADGAAIETRSPVGSEATLAPRLALTETDCPTPYVDESDSCYAYDTLVYADYDTAEDNVVHVDGEYTGYNEWGWGLSNSYNAFTERVERTALVGPQDGWTTADATLHAGEGSYPTRGN